MSQEIDAWDNKNVKNAGCFFPWEHRNFESMVTQAGLVDSFRYLNPDKREYTFFFQNYCCPVKLRTAKNNLLKR